MGRTIYVDIGTNASFYSGKYINPCRNRHFTFLYLTSVLSKYKYVLGVR